MNRRNFIAASAAIAALPYVKNSGNAKESPKNLFIKPKMLNPGDTIGIIAPGSAVSDPDDLAKAREALDYFGLKMKIAKNAVKGSGYRTRTIEERLEDLHSMFLDNEVKGVFCIRGGYGSIQLLDKIDYKLIRNNPKIFLGYSDITAMHLAINKLSGLVTFHGPLLLSAFSGFTVNNFKRALFSPEPLMELKNPDSKSSIRTIHPLRTINPGKASGRLTGGNLSMIASLMGTPYEIETKGKILLLEDVGEEPYRIDRMLYQLKHAKKLQEAAGIIFGECSECNLEGKASKTWDDSLGEVLNKVFADIKVPVFFGLTFGHTADQLTLPFSVESEMDADACILKITESGVIV